MLLTRENCFVGQLVRRINDGYHRAYLTEGKAYKVVEVKDTYVHVINDIGVMTGPLFFKRFEVINTLGMFIAIDVKGTRIPRLSAYRSTTVRSSEDGDKLLINGSWVKKDRFAFVAVYDFNRDGIPTAEAIALATEPFKIKAPIVKEEPPKKPSLLERIQAKSGKNPTASYGVEFEDGTEALNPNDVCHARLGQEYSNRGKIAKFLALNIKPYLDNFSQAGLNKYHKGIKYIIDESPWKDAFTQTYDEAIALGGVYLDINKGSNYLGGAAVALRTFSEHPYMRDNFSMLLDAGVNKHVAYIISSFNGTRDGGLFCNSNWHHVIDHNRSVKNICKFFKTGEMNNEGPCYRTSLKGFTIAGSHFGELQVGNKMKEWWDDLGIKGVVSKEEAWGTTNHKLIKEDFLTIVALNFQETFNQA